MEKALNFLCAFFVSTVDRKQASDLMLRALLDVSPRNRLVRLTKLLDPIQLVCWFAPPILLDEKYPVTLEEQGWIRPIAARRFGIQKPLFKQLFKASHPSAFTHVNISPVDAVAKPKSSTESA